MTDSKLPGNDLLENCTFQFGSTVYKSFLSFIILYTVLLSGCEFQPDEIPKKNISPPSSNVTIEYNLNNFGDTVKIGWKTDFSFQITSNINNIISTEVSFNGQNIQSTQSGMSINFKIDPIQYQDGYHILDIELITKTGSGSIAETLGAEGYIFNFSWPVLIDKTMPDGFNKYMINAQLTENGIELSWPSFNHPNFCSYIIYREDKSIATIFNPLDTTFIDTTYCEGQSYMYYLGIVTPAVEHKYNYTWVYTYITGFETTWNPDGSLKVSWDKPRFPTNYSGYYIYTWYQYDVLIEEHFIEDLEHNHINITNFGSGYGLKLFLKFVPKGTIYEDMRWLGGINTVIYRK